MKKGTEMKPQNQYVENWKKSHVRNIKFYVNIDTEKDVLEHLERQPSKRSYIIRLIRKDMDATENSESGQTAQPGKSEV